METATEKTITRLSDIESLQRCAGFERYFLSRVREKISRAEAEIHDVSTDWERTQILRAKRAAWVEIITMAEQDKNAYIKALQEKERE